MDRIVEVLIWLVLVLVAFVLAIATIESYHGTKLERFCLAHGYSRADWRWFGDNYCITRTDQTDVVVPQNKVK